jgi:acyl-CoA thioester hydrolase
MKVRRVTILEGFRSISEQRVVFRDLDVLGHVNNAVYSTYLETARIDYLSALASEGIEAMNLIMAEITITYKSPAFMRETLLIGTRVSEVRNSSFIVEAQIEEKTTGRLVATSRSVIVHYDYAAGKATPIPAAWREAMARFEGRSF